MTKHIHAQVVRNSGIGSTYDTDIFQCAYDEICICLHNIAYGMNGSWMQFDIPVKETPGYSIKVNKTSIGNDTGKAADLIDFLDTDTGRAFINGMVNKLIFEHPKKRTTPGL